MTSEHKTIETADDVARGIAALITTEPRFQSVLNVTGQPHLRRREAGFAALIRIITDQQISLSAGAAIWSRFEERLGEVTPESVLAASEDDLRETGQSGAKARTMRAVASAIRQGTLNLNRLNTLDDESAGAALMQVKGIGPWTADIYLLACMGRRDVWPAGDVALQTGTQLAFDMDARPTTRELIELAKAWRPWRAVAARLLWAYYRHERMQ